MKPENLQALVDKSILCWLATVDAEGQPNVSPKEVFVLQDATHLLIANIASPNSVRNVRQNARVCVSLLDIFVQKGAKLYGTAQEILPDQPEFSALEGLLLPLTEGLFPIHSILRIEITRTAEILAPSYWMYPESTTEAKQIASAMQQYGVKPAGE